MNTFYHFHEYLVSFWILNEYLVSFSALSSSLTLPWAASISFRRPRYNSWSRVSSPWFGDMVWKLLYIECSDEVHQINPWWCYDDDDEDDVHQGLPEACPSQRRPFWPSWLVCPSAVPPSTTTPRFPARAPQPDFFIFTFYDTFMIIVLLQLQINTCTMPLIWLLRDECWSV